MPKDTCVEHKPGWFVQVRQDYVDLFEGDVYAAILLWIFEYYTTGELDRQLHAGESKEPWLSFSISHLQEESLGLLGERAIHKRMAFLRNKKIIQARALQGGKRNLYLLDYVLVTALLRTKTWLPVIEAECVLSPEAGCTACSQEMQAKSEADCTAAPQPECTAAPQPCSQVPDLNLKVVEGEERIENREDASAPLYDKGQDKPTFKEVSDRVAMIYREHHKHKPSFWGSARGSGEKLMELVERYGLPYVTQVLDSYLGLDDRELHKERHSITVFCRGFSKWAVLPTYVSPATQPEPLPVTEGVPAVTHTEVTPGPSNGRKTDNAPPLPEAAVAWNETVTAGPPVERWSVRDKPLEGALSDPEFVEGLPRMLKICQRLHETQGEEVGWLQFRWLLRKNKQGEDNWYRILNEGAGWGKKKRTSGGRDPDFEAYLDKLQEEDRATHA